MTPTITTPAGLRIPLSVEWIGDENGFARILDQTLLPERTEFLECRDPESVWHAIKRLAVRGAPAIGVAAAAGVVLGLNGSAPQTVAAYRAKVAETCQFLSTSRPTAVNLFWALERMRRVADAAQVSTAGALKQRLWREAQAIRNEDADMCRRIGEWGKALIRDGDGVLTYCNAGSLATAELGTALAPMYLAQREGRQFRAYAPETRPLLQGARLTSYELMAGGVDVTLLCDGMTASLMSQGKINLVITGADRIAANGDAANKIGTLGVAILARHFEIPFYVAAPTSTIDLSTESGEKIPIEHRSGEEITAIGGKRLAPEGVKTYSPAFDVTPAELIRGLVTEKGMVSPVTPTGVAQLMA